MIYVIYIGLCFLVAFAGKGKKIGYGGTFLLSLILSPLIGIIVALVSPVVTDNRKWFSCKKCGQTFPDMPAACPNCQTKMMYSIASFDHVKYNCVSCKGHFFGRKESCPHCEVKNNW